MSHFNYIVTAHNSEALIERVLAGICDAADDFGSHIYLVLDGCTDHTEAVADSVMHCGLTKVWTDDVHELLSINAGLRAAPQDGDGYNIIVQDDVEFRDPLLEQKVEACYAAIPNLGFLSFRMGFNLRPNAWTEEHPYPYFPQWEDIESVYGAGCTGNILMPGWFAYRTFPIKSPICIPCKLVREVGLLNEELAPYAYDDLEYCIRTTTAGYHNGVLSVPFFSDIRWGGSRRPGHPDMMVAIRKNGARVRELWQKELRAICEGPQSIKQVQIWPSTAAEDFAAMKQWHECVAEMVRLGKAESHWGPGQ